MEQATLPTAATHGVRAIAKRSRSPHEAAARQHMEAARSPREAVETLLGQRPLPTTCYMAGRIRQTFVANDTGAAIDSYSA